MSHSQTLHFLEHIARTLKHPSHILQRCDVHSSSFDPYYVRNILHQFQFFNSHKVRPYPFRKIIFHKLLRQLQRSLHHKFDKISAAFRIGLRNTRNESSHKNDHNQICIRRTTQIMNRNFINLMHKLQRTCYSKFMKNNFPKLSNWTIQNLIQTIKRLIVCVKFQMGTKFRSVISYL